jgi:hypothetical protein
MQRNPTALKYTVERQAMKKWTVVNEKCFNIVSQVAFWCILQVLSAVAVQMNINNA